MDPAQLSLYCGPRLAAVRARQLGNEQPLSLECLFPLFVAVFDRSMSELVNTGYASGIPFCKLPSTDGNNVSDGNAKTDALSKDRHAAGLEGQANCPNPTVVVRVELRRRDLHSGSDPKMQSVRNLKITEDYTWREKCFLFASVRPISKEV
jgi:hypothetical protein